MVDTLASGASESNLIGVQISSSAPGRSIPVVRILREDIDWVRFPTARHGIIVYRVVFICGG